MAFPSTLKSGNDLMRLVPQRAFLVLKRALELKHLRERLAQVELVLEDGKGDTHEHEQPEKGAELHHDNEFLKHRINGDARHVWVRTHDRGALEGERLKKLDELLGGELERVAPVYQRSDIPSVLGLVSPQPDQLLIRELGANLDPRLRIVLDRLERPLESPKLGAAILAVLARFGLKEDEAGSALSRPYGLFRTQDTAGHSAYQVGPQLQAFTRNLEVVFKVIPFISPLAGTFYPIDPEFGGAGDDETGSNQWNLKRIGMPYAWFETKGDPNTVVYLLDLGAEFGLGDMPSFTQFRGSDLFPEGATQLNSAHGTAMLGLMGAPHASAPGGGMAGIAPLCTFISIRGALPIANTDLLHAINKISTDTGASPGLKRVFCVAASASSVILQDSANNVALRDTLPADCLICVPSGDYGSGTGTDGLALDPGTGIGYQTYVGTQAAPYNVIRPNLLICGMTTQNDAPAHYDAWRAQAGIGQNNAGSKFGPELSVVAPGVGIQSRTSGGYATFTGTSAATAHVAGIAALVRSKEPGLTGTQVKDRILATAAKTGQFGYSYVSAAPNQSRNDRMGHGRVDAAAVTVWQASGQCNMMVRDEPGDTGAEPSIGWYQSDVLIVPASTGSTVPGDATSVFPAPTTAGSALDSAFTAAVAAGYYSFDATGDHYVFVRVKNSNAAGLPGTGDARCLRASIVLAAISTGFTIDDFMTADDDFAGGVVVPSSDPADPTQRQHGYYAGPVAPGGVVIFRFLVTNAQVTTGLHSAPFQYAPGLYHACGLAMVTASNDVGAYNAVFDVRTQINNITQRNLTVA